MIVVSLPIPIVTLCWIAVCAFVGLIAIGRGRSCVFWSVLAALATPFIGVVLLLLPDRRKKIGVRPPPLPPRQSLPIRALSAVGYRVAESRAIAVLSNAKNSANRSLQTFAASAEIDREISKTIRTEFPNDKTTG